MCACVRVSLCVCACVEREHLFGPVCVEETHSIVVDYLHRKKTIHTNHTPEKAASNIPSNSIPLCFPNYTCTHIGIVAYGWPCVHKCTSVDTASCSVVLTSGSFGCACRHCSALRRASSVLLAYKGMKHLEGGGRRGNGGGGREEGGGKRGEGRRGEERRGKGGGGKGGGGKGGGGREEGGREEGGREEGGREEGGREEGRREEGHREKGGRGKEGRRERGEAKEGRREGEGGEGGKREVGR